MPILNNQQQQQTPAAPEGRRRQGTGFTNIKNILEANKQAGQIMGQGVGTSLGQKAGKLSGDVTAAGQKFQEQQQQLQESLYGQGGALSGARELLPTGTNVSGAGITGLSPEEIERIRKNYEEAQYTGPGGLQNQQQLLSRAGGLQALGQLAGSQYGQGRLLQSAASRRGQYTRGQGLLDQYLLGQDVEAQQAIKDAASQAYGVAQQAATATDVAKAQAEAMKAGVEAEKTGIKQDILKSLGGLKTEAKQSAQRYLSQAERIKDILAGDIKPEDITLEDRDMLANLSKYGIDEATMYSVDDATIDTLIKQMASAGQVAFTEQEKYDTEAQRAAAKNLALLSGQKDIADTIDASRFEREVFESANKGIENVAGEAKKETERLQSATGITTPEAAQQAADKYNRGWESLTGDVNSTEGRYGKGIDLTEGKHMTFLNYMLNPLNNTPPGSFVHEAYNLLGRDAYVSIFNAIANESGSGETAYERNRIIDALAAAYKTKLDDINRLNTRYKSKTSLQDYINKKFGVGGMPQGQG